MNAITSGFVTLLLTLLPLPASIVQASDLLPITVNVRDKPALQRGAAFFMNYCSGCHALQYMRYNQMATGIGLTTSNGQIDLALLQHYLIFTNAKPYDPILNSMPPSDARQWFGNSPPDLSLSARERGADWLYTYLKQFYADPSRPFGTNNALVPDAAMPNVLAPLTSSEVKSTLVASGEMTEEQVNHAIQDVVTFLVYVAEPNQLIRHRIGIRVLCFLSLLLVIVYQLKRVYWRRLLNE